MYAPRNPGLIEKVSPCRLTFAELEQRARLDAAGSHTAAAAAAAAAAQQPREFNPTDIQPGVYLPCISFLGVRGTQRVVYQIGFGATGALLLLSIALLEEHVLPHVTHVVGAGPSIEKCVSRGRSAAYGVLVQGIFTLTPDLGLSCVLHWFGAAYFAWGANNHAILAITIYNMALTHAQPPSALLSPWIARSASWRAGCMKLPVLLPLALPVMFGTSLVSQVLGTAKDDGADREERGLTAAQMQNCMGASAFACSVVYHRVHEFCHRLGALQWLVVFTFVVYFVSFGIDLAVCIAAGPPPSIEDDQSKTTSRKLTGASVSDKAIQHSDGVPADESDAEFLARKEEEEAAAFAQ
eukprot:SAG31_NODE_1496_length_8102_cov_4.478321_4_plen_353_part_00